MLSLTFSSPIGALTVCEEGGRLSALLFSKGEQGTHETPLLLAAKRELSEYFCGRRRAFDLPLVLEGTRFQCAVKEALLQVPYGESVSYSDLAALAGFPGACRAVGNTLHTNPLPILLPCHRVVSAKGLGNYAWGMEKKLFLMRLEGMDV